MATMYSNWHKSNGLAGRLYEAEVDIPVQFCTLSLSLSLGRYSSLRNTKLNKFEIQQGLSSMRDGGTLES